MKVNKDMLLIELTEKKERDWHNLRVIFQMEGTNYHAVAYKYMDHTWKPCEDREVHPYVESEWNNERTTTRVLETSDPLYIEAIVDNL